MSLTLSTLIRNEMGVAAVTAVDRGTTNASGYIEFRTATKPASPQITAPGIVLAILSFSNPAYGSFINGLATANPIMSDENLMASGVCGWFRVYDRDGTPLWDGEVTITGGGGDVEFNNINFIQGGTLHLAELNVLVPE